MGKKILGQRRGRATKLFRASLNKIAPARYPTLTLELETGVTLYRITDLVHETGRGLPLAKLEGKESKKTFYLPATEGVFIGKTLEIGSKASLEAGNVLPLKSIPDSAIISNIELKPGDGGAVCRASGAYATILSRTPEYVNIKLPSGQIRQFSLSARATIGVVSGGGRTEKPILKAGKAFMWKKARAKLGKYPTVRGIVMGHHNHPFGGGSHRGAHTPKTISRHAPPGAKVGLIAARRTGRHRGAAAKAPSESEQTK